MYAIPSESPRHDYTSFDGYRRGNLRTLAILDLLPLKRYLDYRHYQKKRVWLNAWSVGGVNT
jgi:hypothetical protein